MGRKSRRKKERKFKRGEKQVIIDEPTFQPNWGHGKIEPGKKATEPPSPIDPVLMQAYIRGRKMGEKQGTDKGRQEGRSEGILIFADWLEEIDTVPEIGPKRKQAIANYINAKIKEYLVQGGEAARQMRIDEYD